jgi:hypothetical protein
LWTLILMTVTIDVIASPPNSHECPAGDGVLGHRYGRWAAADGLVGDPLSTMEAGHEL